MFSNLREITDLYGSYDKNVSAFEISAEKEFEEVKSNIISLIDETGGMVLLDSILKEYSKASGTFNNLRFFTHTEEGPNQKLLQDFQEIAQIVFDCQRKEFPEVQGSQLGTPIQRSLYYLMSDIEKVESLLIDAKVPAAFAQIYKNESLPRSGSISVSNGR